MKQKLTLTVILTFILATSFGQTIEGEDSEEGGESENGDASGKGGKAPERENLDPDAGKSEQQIIDELTGQTSLFDDKKFTEEDEKDKEWLAKH